MREITRGLASLMGIALLAHCSRSAPEPQARSTALFSDAAHGGNPHFYLLPPIVPAPAWSGIFDGTLSPVVIVCRLSGSACAAITARFSMTGGTGAQTVRVDSANELYIVNWHTDECLTGPCTLPDGGLYRVKVTVAGALLGFADLEVVASRAEAKKVDANEYFALLDGRTVPIKFRIEKGAISLLPPSGGAAQVGPGGGAVAISNGAASLVFPPGALTSTVSISLSPAAAWPLTEMVGAVYDLGPDGASFASPVTLGIAWPGPAAGVDESKLELSTAETGDLWEAVSGASVDTAAHSASGPITHFSKGAVLGPVRAVTVSPGSVSLVAGSGVQLAATTTPTNHKVKWMVSNPAVASVSATGLVNGVSPGTATITARSGAASGTAAVSVAPPAPAITSPPSGTSTTGGAIAVSGTANPGAAIDIFDGAGLVASASADLSGSFSVAVSLEIGMHSLTAQQTINGETSAASSTVSVEVKPPAPAITAPVNLFDTTSTTLAIAGTGVPGATIALADGGNGSLAIPAGPITVDAGGIWSVTATLGYGAHRLGAIQIRNGEASVASDALEGHVRPAAPAIVSPASGTARTNGSVAVSGAAIANASVTLFDGGSAVASVTADGGGLFGAIVSLAIGPHALTATQQLNGETSGASSVVAIEIKEPVVAPPGSPAFMPAASMAIAREFDSAEGAIELPGGNVLVAGGGSSQVFDPATGMWSAASSMSVRRRSFSIGLLSSGQVIAAGGFDGGNEILGSSELYDPSADVWSAGPPLSLGARAGGSFVVLGGKLLIAGGPTRAGDCTYRSDAEMFDAAGGWSPTGSLQQNRESGSAALLAGGKVLIAGGPASGCPSDHSQQAEAEIYDPSLRSWSVTGPLSNPRGGFTLTALADGKALVAGGYGGGGFLAAAELYDPATGAFTPTGALNTPRTGHTATLLPNGNVLVVGGTNASGAVLASAEIYQPSTGLWTEVPAFLSTPRTRHAAALLASGQVLVAGGSAGASMALASAEIFAQASVVTGGAGAVLTQHNDIARTGLNAAETQLTWQAVQMSFGKLFTVSVVGRIFAQPLYAPGVVTPSGLRDMVIVATEHNMVYALDAHTGAAIWSNPVSLGPPIPTSDVYKSPCINIPDEVGITGTPVIDPISGTIYVVAATQEGGSWKQRLHAIDLATSAVKKSQVITGAVQGTDATGAPTTIAFDPRRENQRAGLLLLNGKVYVAWASHCDDFVDAPNQVFFGWLMAFDAATLDRVDGLFNAEPYFNPVSLDPNVPADLRVVAYGGSIWQSAGGIASDGQRIFVTTGNGVAAPGNRQYGDSVIALPLPIPQPNLNQVPDWFTPADQVHLNQKDLDLSAGGVVIIPDSVPAHPNLLVTAGKNGTIYLLDRNQLGGTQTGSADAICPSGTAPGNCAVSVDVGATGVVPGEAYYGQPAYFNGHLYFAGNGDSLKRFAVGGASIFSGPDYYSANTFKYPGATPSISANGTADSIVWALERTEPEPFVFPDKTYLHAYRATDLFDLYDSNAAGVPRGVRTQDNLPHTGQFVAPTVGGGFVYIAAGSTLAWFGLFTVATPVISPRDGTIFSGTQTVTISDTTPGATIYYTFDGTDPAPDNLSSSVYSNSFSVSTSTYVKARAYVGNSQTSDVAAAHLFHSTCGVACSNGCCQNGQCNTQGFPNCGTDGNACTSCDPAKTNMCLSDGTCGCHGTPPCGPGLHCGQFACQCDETSCNGCCKDGIYGTCQQPVSVNFCGPAGALCTACDINVADGCGNGSCTCGGGPACTNGRHCISGICTIPTPLYEGYFDAAQCDVVFGWAWDRNSPASHTAVDVYSDGVRVLSGLPAIYFRQDLLDAGIGDGTHAWGTGTPVSLKDGEPHVLDARHSANGASLGTSPKNLLCGAKIAWIQPAEAAGFGPPGTFTVAGYAYGGSGNVQLIWRDKTSGGPWTVVDYLAPVNEGVWYNTIGPAPVNECHTYEAYAIYDGGTSAIFTYDASTSGYCQESASIIWMQPQPLAGFGPADNLIVAGSATGAPPDVQVFLYYQDLTAGGGWSQVSYAPLPDSTGIWYNAFPADYTHQYEAYVKYDIRQSGSCAYAGDGNIVWCP